ncbi:CUE domain containing 1 [Mus musculus]|nr:CUE domain containing 1 [Mus musculus]
MTSLFRRSSSGSGGGGATGARGAGTGAGDGSTAPQELNNSRPARQVRRLEFNQAMDDFKTMFPNMDYDIIECVLRANSGAVDATIDQLLQMNLEAGGGSAYEDSSDSEDSIPPEILERTLEPDSSEEEPPPVYSPPAYHMHVFDRPYLMAPPTPPPRTLEPDSSEEEPPPVYSPPAYHMHVFDRPYLMAPPTPPPRIDVPGSGQPASQRRYRNWNPPLLGSLPDDFLRILPQQMDSIQGHPGGSKPMSGEGGPPPAPGPMACDQDSRWKQYLEDERIALFLQNEEFMKELQRNRDFLLALERGTSETNPTVSEDALFRDKLKHMGKSTRRKLFELARAFSEKTKMRKSKKKHLPKLQSYPSAWPWGGNSFPEQSGRLGAAASTANLLDDVEGHAYGEAGASSFTLPEML